MVSRQYTLGPAGENVSLSAPQDLNSKPLWRRSNPPKLFGSGTSPSPLPRPVDSLTAGGGDSANICEKVLQRISACVWTESEVEFRETTPLVFFITLVY